MMSQELLQIHPRELKFTFELKKQSSCLVQLVSNSDQCVAFKVKTTSPKKYCVRPNIGIVQPRSTCDFTVTMQAQREEPPDLQCKDKFLIQSMVVPLGTTVEDITPIMFTKDNGRYIEENKLRVVLVSPPRSPVLLPVNGALKQELNNEPSILKGQVMSGDENLPPLCMVLEEVKSTKGVDMKSAWNVEEMKLAKEIGDLELGNAILELNSKIDERESKLREAGIAIAKLKEERSRITQECEALWQELAVVKKQSGARRVQVGFPFLFVVMMALVSVALGLWLRS
uniref:MSP domain-containing protein n=1 Tax=Nelumbo nucifera TaxID=4432 RepID=A0A822YRP6_NELNU|nr:TPA_asm: hypothetical protein HUJ06_012307 [Nelumbo nucifera]